MICTSTRPEFRRKLRVIMKIKLGHPLTEYDRVQRILQVRSERASETGVPFFPSRLHKLQRYIARLHDKR